VTVIVKSGFGITVSVMVVLLDTGPVLPVPVLLPVMVTFTGPTAAFPVAVNFSVLPAEPVTMGGLKLAVTPAGRGLVLKVIAPPNPLTVETVTLVVAEAPCSTDTSVEETLKPGPRIPGTTGKAF